MLGVNDAFDDGVSEVVVVVVVEADVFDEGLNVVDALELGDEEPVTDGFVVGVVVELIDAFDDPEGDKDALDDNVVMFDTLGDALPLAVAVVLLDAVGVIELVTVGDALDDTFDVALSDVVGVVVIELLGVVEMFKGAETLGELLVVVVTLAFEDGVPVMLGVNDTFEDGVREADLVVVADAVVLALIDTFDEILDKDDGVALSELFVVSDPLTLGDIVIEAFDDADTSADLLTVVVMLAVDDGLSKLVLVGDEEGVTDRLKVGVVAVIFEELDGDPSADGVVVIDTFDDALLLGVAVDVLELEAVSDCVNELLVIAV